MVDVDNSRLYEVLPMDVPAHNNAWKGPKLSHSKSYGGSSVPSGYSNYAVPRGVNGTPPTTKAIPPAVPPRNRNMSEGEGHNGLGSQGNSPNDKGGLFPSRLRTVSGVVSGPSKKSPRSTNKKPEKGKAKESKSKNLTGKFQT